MVGTAAVPVKYIYMHVCNIEVRFALSETVRRIRLRLIHGVVDP